MSEPKSSSRGVVAQGVVAGDHWIRVEPDQIRATLGRLQAEGYSYYLFITCVDHLGTPLMQRPPQRFEVVYQLRDMAQKREIRVRVFLPEDSPVVPSVQDIYPPANWDERETWDLFGIQFEGHPNLTRILMPDDWIGYPLRRDFPVGGEPVDFSEDHETWQTAPPLA